MLLYELEVWTVAYRTKTTQTELFTVQDGDVKDRPSHVDNQLLVMRTYQRGQKVGQHSVSAGLFIYFHSNRTLCTGPFPHWGEADGFAFFTLH